MFKMTEKQQKPNSLIEACLGQLVSSYLSQSQETQAINAKPPRTPVSRGELARHDRFEFTSN